MGLLGFEHFWDFFFFFFGGIGVRTHGLALVRHALEPLFQLHFWDIMKKQHTTYKDK
jgi:hypothetical protein